MRRYISSRLREDTIVVYTFTYKMLMICGGVNNRLQLNGQMPAVCSYKNYENFTVDNYTDKRTIIRNFHNG